jgi:hypothetical protein
LLVSIWPISFIVPASFAVSKSSAGWRIEAGLAITPMLGPIAFLRTHPVGSSKLGGR